MKLIANLTVNSVKFKYQNVLFLLFVCIQFFLQKTADARIHHLTLQNDIRSHFKVSSFGYFIGGTLKVSLDYVDISPFVNDALIGFTLVKTNNKNLKYEDELQSCSLTDDVTNRLDFGITSMVFDFKNSLVRLSCSSAMINLPIKPLSKYVRFKRKAVETDFGTTPLTNQTDSFQKQSIASSAVLNKTSSSSQSNLKSSNSSIQEANSIEQPLQSEKDDLPSITKKQMKVNDQLEPIKTDKSIDSSHIENKSKVAVQVEPESLFPKESDVKSTCRTSTLPLKKLANNKYSFTFQIDITNHFSEGLYSLYFHNCQNFGLYGKSFKATQIGLSLHIEEKNFDSYLSAGEISLPNLYFFLSFIFFMIGFLWANVLRSRRENVFKVHQLMAVLVFMKAFSLFFHSIDYYCISMNGVEIETWAILYYTANFIKGALLFITIILIGTGWAFVKPILSDKDKKIFMIVIPLQVLANVAQILTEESELGEFKHRVWKAVFSLVDLLCCGAIMFPVVWSIKHLQEASHIDGKAAINLEKLQLFRRFYVMIVCYIYFTRIIVYLMQTALPFSLDWLDDLFQHVATLIFFVTTGYYFQPTTTNPYFMLTDDDLEMEEVLFSASAHMMNSTKKRNRDFYSDQDDAKTSLMLDHENDQS